MKAGLEGGVGRLWEIGACGLRWAAWWGGWVGGRGGNGRIVTEGIGGSSGWAGWAWVGKVVSLEPGNVVSKPGGKVGFS